jgi:glycolate oxidase iron-sulfur subunit
MREGLQPGSEMSDEMVAHFDRCLGCMACVTACPSGVQYDRLIERVRPQVERHHRRPRAERVLRRLLYETLPHPKRLRALAPLLASSRKLGVERLPDRLSMMAKVAPRTPVAETWSVPPQRTPAVGEPRGRVGLLLGCVQRVFYPQVHAATVHALAAEGFEVIAPRRPDCCGALELHGGAEEGAAQRANATMDAFARAGGTPGLDYIVVNAAGCGSAMKDYGDLLETHEAKAFSARVRDVVELLGEIEPRAPRGPVPLRIAYHDACHLAHAQGVRQQPRELLAAIPGLAVREIEDSAICCGSAGIYNILNPAAAGELGDRKAANVLATGAELLITANPGCLMQVASGVRRAGGRIALAHTAQVIDASIRGLTPGDL